MPVDDLAKCKTEACDPIFQVRGQMGPGDYMNVWLPNGQPDLNFHEKIEMSDESKSDIRILCKTCGLATGWFQQNFANAPGAGKDYLVVKVWPAMVKKKQDKEDMLAAMTKQFGEEAVKKHFGLAL